MAESDDRLALPSAVDPDAADLDALRRLAQGTARDHWTRLLRAERRLHYVVDLDHADDTGLLAVELRVRAPRRDGAGECLAPLPASQLEPAQLADARDREIVGTLRGAEQPCSGARPVRSARFVLAEAGATAVVEAMCRTGRLHAVRAAAATQRLEWDDGAAWEFGIRVEHASRRPRLTVQGFLSRAGARAPLAEFDALLLGAFALRGGQLARADFRGAAAAAALLRRAPIAVPATRRDALLESILALPGDAHLELPASMTPGAPPVPPLACLHAARDPADPSRLLCRVRFDYGTALVEAGAPGRAVRAAADGAFVQRDLRFELAAARRALAAGLQPVANVLADRPPLAAGVDQLADLARRLTGEGWAVTVDERPVVLPLRAALSVDSRPDWLELRGGLRYGNEIVPLPAVLAAARRRRGTVPLADGGLGLVPPEWMQRIRSLLELGEQERDVVRFRHRQAGLLDALLLAQPEVAVDDAFARVRARLRRFDGIPPRDAPASFCGTLRHYQRQALGWFDYLREFGFGGCLADDMGLGKTVQVLALLAERQARHAGASLVVMPSAVLFHWADAARAFAPGLRVLEYRGPNRQALLATLRPGDLLLATYGVLRLDAAALADVAFDYVVLDEAHLIKNPSSQVAKATRLLRAHHRLALTGTPVENHAGDLWSLFEFLNPGLLGRASAFEAARSGAADDEGLALINRGLRPFFLRRTKQQVVRDLPPKTEQLLRCELGPAQRHCYDSLRDHYREELVRLSRSGGQTERQATMLEALLRLRQAACHPGLIDPGQRHAASAKLDVLMARLAELCAERHKAVVFSQFTGMLDLLEPRLDAAGIRHSRLDGSTRDRRAAVQRFTEHDDCQVFAVSLKAGGFGLNLTAADYVFLLDPWWNPAAEAQAIDRCHRIGQRRPVFAYRLVAADTVEEKVLALQDHKRRLASALVPADDAVLRTLSRADLQALLA